MRRKGWRWGCVRGSTVSSGGRARGGADGGAGGCWSRDGGEVMGWLWSLWVMGFACLEDVAGDGDDDSDGDGLK